jgi:uncharacterized protein YjbI with pentapeptide repeats
MRNIKITKANLENVNLSGSDMRGANLTIVFLVGVDLSGANLEGIKYDKITLPSIAASKLNGTKMSPDLQKDLKELVKLG